MLLRRLLVALFFGALGFSTNAIADSPPTRLPKSARTNLPLWLSPMPKDLPSDFLRSLRVVVCIMFHPPAATPRQVAPRSGSSPIPLLTYPCLIGVRQINNNQFMGYLTPATSRNAITVQTSAVNALVGAFKIPVGVTSQSGMLVYDMSSGLVLGGLSTTSAHQPMSNGLSTYVTLTSLDPPSDTPPTYTNGFFEWAIWSYNVGIQILTPQWVNPDGTMINLNVDVMPNGVIIRLTGRSLVTPNANRAVSII
ncbi:hypothetical protein R3P38DRAFT_3169607 [Favolaschia claudopus]|uniref:Uncharacterized protein n=1 Tax=Favolaschia claudopus TaxID=2862362 RepID=A0AAW0E3W2_9AGAR